MTLRFKFLFSLLAMALLALLIFSPGAYKAWQWEKRMDPRSGLGGDDLAAWDLLAKGLTSIKTDREQAASIFKKIADRYPKSGYAEQCDDLSENLTKMVEEDREWKEPENLDALSEAEMVHYWVYHLRNVSCYQVSQPGMCYLLSEHFQVSPETPNAAIELRKMGDVVIPAMIELLDDRRVTSSVGYWRDFAPSRTVLRYQDAATQILNELMPEAFYGRTNTSADFSTEKPEVKEQVKTAIKTWFEESHGKSDVEKKWIAIESGIGIYPTIRLLEELAEAPGQRERVIRKLNDLPASRHAFQLPQISFALAKLGDRKYVKQVVEAYHAGNYDYALNLPDDSAAGANAQEYASLQISLVRRDENRPAGDLQTYLVLLAGGLDNSAIYSSEGIRSCDRAAMAIQVTSGKAFGFENEMPIEERDEIIESIKAWVQSLPE